MRFASFLVCALAAACGSSSEPAPPAPPPSSDAGASSDASQTPDASSAADACVWSFSCGSTGGKCICTGGKLDGQPCASQVECLNVCKTSCD